MVPNDRSMKVFYWSWGGVERSLIRRKGFTCGSEKLVNRLVKERVFKRFKIMIKNEMVICQTNLNTKIFMLRKQQYFYCRCSIEPDAQILTHLTYL